MFSYFFQLILMFVKNFTALSHLLWYMTCPDNDQWKVKFLGKIYHFEWDLQLEKECHCERMKDLSRHVYVLRTLSERNGNEWITFNLSSFSFGLKKLWRKKLSAWG